MKFTAQALGATLLIGISQASPIYYTFAGTVSACEYAQLPVGTAVEFVVMVDRERMGVIIHHETIFPLNGSFYAETYGALPDFSALPEIAGGTGLDKRYFGRETEAEGIPRVILYAADPYYLENPDSHDRTVDFAIESDIPMNAWHSGQTGFLGSFAIGSIQSDLTLADISDTNPMIPEPSGWVTLLSGIGIILGTGRSLKRKSA